MVDALARAEPFWRAGTRNVYHALTFGYLVGEVIRRVDGRTLGAFFRDEVAGPLGLDFWLGLPRRAALDARICRSSSVDRSGYRHMRASGHRSQLVLCQA